jgi:hypothetical protein
VQQHQQQHLHLPLDLAQPAQGQLLVVHLGPLAAVQAVQLHQVLLQLLRLAQVHLVVVPLASVQAVQQQAAAVPQVACLVVVPLAAQAAQVLVAAACLARLVLAAAAGPQVQRRSLGRAVQQAQRLCLAVPAVALMVLAVRLALCCQEQAAVQQQLARLCLALLYLLLLQTHLLAHLLPQQLVGCLVVPAMQQGQQALARRLHLVQQQHRRHHLVAVQQLLGVPLVRPLPQARQHLGCRAAHQRLELQQAPLHSARLAVHLAQVLVYLEVLEALRLLDSSSSSLAVALHHRHSVRPLVSLHSLLLHLAKLPPLDSSSSSHRAASDSRQHLDKQRRLQQGLARQLHSGRQPHQQHRLARLVRLVLLLAALQVEALLHLLLPPARPLAQVAAALLHLLRQATQGLGHWLVVGLAVARLLGLVRLEVHLRAVRLGRLHHHSSPACGVVRGVECCCVVPSAAGCRFVVG